MGPNYAVVETCVVVVVVINSVVNVYHLGVMREMAVRYYFVVVVAVAGDDVAVLHVDGAFGVAVALVAVVVEAVVAYAWQQQDEDEKKTQRQEQGGGEGGDDVAAAAEDDDEELAFVPQSALNWIESEYLIQITRLGRRQRMEVWPLSDVSVEAVA